jgi:hypothetical protein
MIGIKGMELPKSCRTMDGNERAEQSKCCPFEDYGFCWLDEKRLTFEFINTRHPNCPLVDLGKEDMDFEDLKEKCKNISTGNYNHYFSVRIDSGTIFSFYETGTISIEQENDLTKDDYIQIFNKTPFEMYQIISKKIILKN